MDERGIRLAAAFAAKLDCWQKQNTEITLAIGGVGGLEKELKIEYCTRARRRDLATSTNAGSACRTDLSGAGNFSGSPLSPRLI